MRHDGTRNAGGSILFVPENRIAQKRLSPAGQCIRVALRAFGTALLVFALSCIKFDSTNPYLADYPGVYDLRLGLPDSLYLFRTYELPCTTGADTFLTLTVPAALTSLIDTSALNVSYTTLKKSGEPRGTLTVRFRRVFAGTFTLEAHRPSGQVDRFAKTMRVINPYAIAVDSTTLAGQAPVALRVRSRAPTTSDSAFTVVWLVDNARADSLPFSTPLRHAPVSSPATFTVAARLKNSLGDSIALDSFTVRHVPAAPSLSFGQSAIEAPLGREFTLDARVSACDSIRWIVSAIGLDSTAAGALTITFPDSGVYTVIAQGIGALGYRSAPDTLLVDVRHFTYGLQTSRALFPDTIRARRWADWNVSVTKNGTAYAGADIVYRWATTPDSAWDSLKLSAAGDRLSLYFADSVPPVLVSVRAIVGADSTYLHAVPVVVRRLAPSCTFTTANFSTPINEDVTVTVAAADRNSDGGVAGIYYRTSEDTAAVSTGGLASWKVSFKTPGYDTVWSWAVDNDGFRSDTARLIATVTANKPYFKRPSVDTAIFMHDSLRLTVEAVPGNALDTIKSYLWDWGSDGSVERTTTTGRFDTLLTSPCTVTVRVGCRDNRLDSAALPATIRVIVRDGAPVVRSVLLTPHLSFIGAPVTVGVVAGDTNGVVTRIALRIDGGVDSVFTVRAGRTVDTSFALAFANAGTYRIEAAAFDNHDRKSAYVAPPETLTVSTGDPILRGIKPDTVWINDTVQYTLSAVDVNGTVGSWAVRWQPGTLWEGGTDSVFSHIYNSHGVKQVRALAYDNDGRRSDTLDEQVFVRLGRPRAVAVFPESVWIFDTVSYKVAGLDTNGTVRRWAVSWDTGLSFDMQFDSVFAHAFTSEGDKSLKAFVVDDDQLRSDTVAAQVFVKLGRPRIGTVTTDSARSGIFVRDSIAFTVKGSDADGHIDSVVVVWGPGEIDRRRAAGDSAVVKHAFGVAQSGSRVVKITARDDNGIWADTVYDTVAVRAGKPVVTALTVDTSAQNLFIGDNRTFTVSFADTNGAVDSVKVDNGGGTFGAWQKVSGSSHTFTRIFAASESGSRTVRVVVKDDDGVESEQVSLGLDVRLGAPVVWGDAGDTLWVVIDNGAGTNYDLHVRSLDTNGVIVRYYWDERTTFDSTTLAAERRTADSLFSRTIGINEVNTGWPIWIYARDNDNLVRGGQFTVYADGPPPSTVPTAPAYDSVVNAGTNVILRWKRDDVLDRKNTKFQIVTWGGASADTVRVDWTTGATYFVNNDGADNHYAYTFTPDYPASRTVYWRVDAKDARESFTKGGQSQFLYIKP